MYNIGFLLSFVAPVQLLFPLLNSNLSNKNGYIAYASNDSLENIIENNISNMKQFIEYTFHVDNIIGTPFPSNNNVIVKVIITNDNKNSYNVEVADTTTSKKYYITKTNGTFGPWTTSIVDLDSNLTPNAFKNTQLIVQDNVDLLNISLSKNETRMISLTTAINSPIVSTGMALHKMEYTNSEYFTNIVTLFILDSSETWHNYYHSATKQWVGWVKS